MCTNVSSGPLVHENRIMQYLCFDGGFWFQHLTEIWPGCSKVVPACLSSPRLHIDFRRPCTSEVLARRCSASKEPSGVACWEHHARHEQDLRWHTGCCLEGVFGTGKFYQQTSQGKQKHAKRCRMILLYPIISSYVIFHLMLHNPGLRSCRWCLTCGGSIWANVFWCYQFTAPVTRYLYFEVFRTNWFDWAL